MALTVDAVASAFAALGQPVNDEAVLNKCFSLCQQFAWSPSTLADHWESFVTNNNVEDLNLETLNLFAANLGKQTAASSNSQPASTRKAARTPAHVTPRSVERTPMYNKENIAELISPDTSGVKRPPEFSSPEPGVRKAARTGDNTVLSPEPVLPSPSVLPKYGARTNAGKRVLELNAKLGRRGKFQPSSQPGGLRCAITLVDEVGAADRYRFAFTPLDERAKALDKGVLAIQQLIVDRHNLELTPVGIPRQEEVTVVGRVCCEAAEGRINKMSVVLEGSRRESGGHRVHLDLGELRAFALFPGQVVAAQGVNSSGTTMVVRSLIEGVPRPLGTSSPAELSRFHHAPEFCGGRALSLLAASGPFSTSDNLDYEPLNDLLAVVAETRPDVVVLCGPFVDIQHPAVAEGDASVETADGGLEAVDFETLFKLRVSGKLEQLFEDDPDLPTQFVLVPSLRDAFHEFVYPQPPFHDRVPGGVEFGLGELSGERVFNLDLPRTKGAQRRVHLVSNPAMFKMNEVTIGVTSTDVLFDLSADEVSANTGNRLARLTEHLLGQHSFYPLFPPPPSATAQVDLRHAAKWRMPVTPDVLLVPSRLAHFARDIQGCLCVNPGQLARGAAGGTFAQLNVHPLPKEPLDKAAADGSVAMGHSVAARTCAEVIQI